MYELQFAHFIKLGKICPKFGTFYNQLSASAPGGFKIFQFVLNFQMDTAFKRITPKHFLS